MKSTREKILQILLRKPGATLNDLAEAVEINPISVRHHITSLQADGLINVEEERHGVGRPRQVYNLSEQGLEKFPTRYLRLTTRLLATMKETLPNALVKKLFAEVAEGLAEEHKAGLDGLGIEERLSVLQDLLGDEGFVVEWEKKGNDYHIHEITCPYLHVGQNHPEVCSVDQTLISAMLAVSAEKVQCVLSGASHCTYVVSSINMEENA